MRFRSHVWRALAVSSSAVVISLAQTGGGAQQPQAAAELTQRDVPFTFSSSVNLVLVPVVVRDAQGRAVGTLKKEDFQLFDKGKLQEISRFSIEKAEAPPTLPDTSIQTDANGNPQAKAAASAAQPIAGHFVMWLFDDMHLSFGDLAQTREAAKKVLRESFAPGTRAAIYTTSGHTSLDFTDDRDKLEATLNEIKPWPTIPGDAATKPCPDAPYSMADAALNRNDTQALLAIQTDFLLCPETQGMVAAAGFGATDPQAQKAGVTSSQVSSYLQSGTGALLRMELVKTVEIDFQDTRNTLLILKGLIRRMSAMPGSRAIVMVSPGFYLVDAHRTDETDLINSAIRSNVVISTLDARGLWTVTPGGNAEATPGAFNPATQATKLQYEQAANLANQDILEELAMDTGGGYFHDNNDFAAGLKLLATQPEYIYVLGFAPQNLKLDGSYHKLKIVLKSGAGMQMEARRGYFERNHLENPADEAKEELKEAFFSRDEIRELPVELNTQFFRTSDSKARLSILARIDVKHLHFRKTDGRNGNTLTVVGGVFDRNGNFVVGTQKIVDLKLRDQTLDGLPESGITVKTNLDVASGDYIVRLVVRDSEGQVMSAINGAVVIP
jgi:VWFA-related protein